VFAAIVLVVSNLVDLSAIASVGSACSLMIFLLVGVAFARAMSGFRLLRDNWVKLRVVSGLVLVALGLLLFFHREWWLYVGLRRVLDAVGLARTKELFLTGSNIGEPLAIVLDNRVMSVATMAGSPLIRRSII
jgi:hypothetical protein